MVEKAVTAVKQQGFANIIIFKDKLSYEFDEVERFTVANGKIYIAFNGKSSKIIPYHEECNMTITW